MPSEQTESRISSNNDRGRKEKFQNRRCELKNILESGEFMYTLSRQQNFEHSECNSQTERSSLQHQLKLSFDVSVPKEFIRV
jgi:hypothetical protein